MNESNPYNNYSAADIECYHSGNMTAAEKNAMEKAALDDAFLADALEGYSYTASPTADVALLEKRLAEKLEKGKVIALPFYGKNWLRVAALFVLVAGGALLVWQLNKQPENNLAVAEKTANEKSLNQLSAPPSPDSIAATDGFFDSAAAANDGTIALKENKNQNATSLSSAAGVKDESVASRQTFSPPSSATDAPNKIAEAKQQNNAGNSDIAANRNQSLTNNNQSANNSQSANSPSPNANNGLVNRRTNNATGNDVAKRSAFADKNQLAQKNRADTNNSDVEEDLAERLSDAKSKSELAKRNQSDTTRINVVMQPVDNALNEVVVVGYGAKSKAPKRKEPVAEILEPAKGWSNYNDYIALNLQEPPELKEKAITGEVELSFDINKKGEAVNIKVEKGLCAECDEEAVRLLKEGPKWKTKKKEKKGKVRIRF